MIFFFSRPVPLMMLLLVCTGISVMVSAVQVVQIPLGALPQDTLRLAVVPITHFLHVLTGTLFGLLGPLQFFNVLRHRFGLLHRVTGWVFVLSGWALGLSGWGLLMGVEHISTELLVVARGVFGLALMAALVQAVLAALAGDIVRHRAWMIRAYVIGMGSGTAGLVMLPIYLATGEPVYGLFSDLVVIAMWLISILAGEWVIRRLALHKPQMSTAV